MFGLSTWVVWLILCGIFLVVEVFTVTFMMFWPGVAAFITSILALLNVPVNAQIAIFCILSILFIVATKPITNKLFKSRETNTNAKYLIGKKGIVLKTIDTLNNLGQVKIAGETWSAISDEIIPVNDTIEIIGIEGVKVKVKKVN